MGMVDDHCDWMAMLGLRFKPMELVTRTISWINLGIFAIDLFNTYVIHPHGE